MKSSKKTSKNEPIEKKPPSGDQNMFFNILVTMSTYDLKANQKPMKHKLR